MPIPKKIHYVWLGGKNKPPAFEKFLATWREKCPDYEIFEWNEKNCDFSDSPYAVQAYAAKKYAFVSDYVRVKVLTEEGGVYLDTDVELIKPLDDLLNESFVLSLENDVYAETAVIMSEAHHPLLEKMEEFYRTIEFTENGKQNVMPNPFYFTYFLCRDYGFELKSGKTSREGVSVLPKEYFAPKDYLTRKLCITENTRAVHHFDASWGDKKLGRQEKWMRFARRLCGRKLYAVFTRAYVKSAFRKIDCMRKNGRR